MKSSIETSAARSAGPQRISGILLGGIIMAAAASAAYQQRMA